MSDFSIIYEGQLLNAISSLFFKNIQLFNSEQTFLTFYFVILVIILSRQRYTFFKSEKQIRTRIQWLDCRNVRKQLDIMPNNHYVQNQGKLLMQSRENGQKPQFGYFFWRFRRQISSNCKFFWKIGLIQIEGHIEY